MRVFFFVFDGIYRNVGIHMYKYANVHMHKYMQRYKHTYILYIFWNKKKSLLVTVEEEVITGDVDSDRLHAFVDIIQRPVLLLEVAGLSDRTLPEFVVGLQVYPVKRVTVRDLTIKYWLSANFLWIRRRIIMTPP